jgi:hypothetical protein
MADKDDIWTKVKARYPEDTLIDLTSVQDPDLGAIDDTYGTDAADEVLDLWEMNAEVDFDVANTTHLSLAVRATFAVMMVRARNTPDAQLAYDRVFGSETLEGEFARFRRTGPRGRLEPTTTGPTTTTSGEAVRPYSSRKAMPTGFLPSDSIDNGDDD